MMNKMLGDLLENKVVVYIDERLIYWNKIEEDEYCEIEVFRCVNYLNLS
jgi:predicted methyltransferase